MSSKCIKLLVAPCSSDFNAIDRTSYTSVAIHLVRRVALAAVLDAVLSIVPVVSLTSYEQCVSDALTEVDYWIDVDADGISGP